VRRVVAATGAVSTLAGNGTCGTVPVDGTGTGAMLMSPAFVAFDGIRGAVFVTEYVRCGGVRAISLATQATSLVVNGFASSPCSTALYFPAGIALVPGANTLYVASYLSNKIVAVTISTGATTVLAGSGTAGVADGVGASASMSPFGLAIDAAGANLYFTDRPNSLVLGLVRRVAIASNAVTTPPRPRAAARPPSSCRPGGSRLIALAATSSSATRAPRPSGGSASPPSR
jgi:DNA-binding beta-propeller fold protein YncE